MLKKVNIIFFGLVFIFTFISFGSRVSSAADSENSFTESDMYVSAIQKLVFSTVSNAVKSRYDYNARIDFFDINIENLDYDSQGNIVMIATFNPYIGPHNSISSDWIKLWIRASGIEVLEYRSSKP